MKHGGNTALFTYMNFGSDSILLWVIGRHARLSLLPAHRFGSFVCFLRNSFARQLSSSAVAKCASYSYFCALWSSFGYLSASFRCYLLA